MTGMLNAELERTTFQYDAANRRVAVINPMRETISYRYDKAGQLLAEIMPNDGRTSYNYDAAGQNYRVIDPNGNITTTGYDLLGRPKYRIDANTTNRWSTVYDAVGRVTQQVRPSGASTQYAYDKLGRRIRTIDPTGAIWTSVYDKAGRLLQQIDPRRMTTIYRYDLDGRRIQTKTPLGFISTSVYDSDGSLIGSVDQENFRTTYLYDADHQLVRTTDPHLYMTTYVYDADGRQRVLINAEQERVTSTFDKVGRVVKTLDPLAQRTTIRYDKAGRVTREILVNSGINTYSYDINGNLRRRVNAVGNITTSIYDVGNRQIASIDGEGKRWSTTYDALNRISRTVDPLLNVNTSRYDVDGRLSSSIDANSARTTFGYDPANRRIRILDANNKIWTTAYDTAGRMTGSIPPSLHRTTYSYDNDNRTIAVTDPNNNQIAYVYDKRGLRRSLRFPSPQPPVTYSYDGAGWRTQRTDGRGNRTTYSFDKVGREILWDYPASPSVSFVYDKLGRVTDRTDHSGRYTTTYSPLGQVTTERRAGTTESATFAVDNVGRRTAYAATYPVGQLSLYAYDKNDRLTRLNAVLGSGVSTFVYDAAGRRSYIKRPNQSRTSFSYDNVGRIAEVFHFSTSGTYTPFASLTYTYDAVGNPIRLLDSGTSIVTWTYDADYQLRREYRTGSAPYHITHTYDPAGNRISENANGALTTFAYDAAGQVRRSQQGAGAPTTFTYDADGNLASQSTLTSRWDEDNRLVRQAQSPILTSTMVYDFAGRKRQWQTSFLGTPSRTTFVWDHWNVQQIAATSSPKTITYDLEPRQYGQIVAQNTGAERSFFHYDAIDSTIVRSNSASSAIENNRYSGYGTIRLISGASTVFGWIGGQGYEVSGFPSPTALYIRQRWYGTGQARWWGRDPLIVEFGSIYIPITFLAFLPPAVRYRMLNGVQSIYNYSANRPTRNFDPTGMEPSSQEHRNGLSICHIGLDCTRSFTDYNDELEIRICSYTCIVTKITPGGLGGEGCAGVEFDRGDEVPYTIAKSAKRNWSDYYQGKARRECGFPCPDTLSTEVLYDPTKASDCNAQECKDRCEKNIETAADFACQGLKGLLKKACKKAVIQAGAAFCVDVCLSWCKKYGPPE